MPSLPLCYITLEDFRASHFLEWSVQKKEFIHHAHNINIQVLSRLSLSVIIWLFPQPEKPHAQCKKILKNDLWKSHYPKLEKTIALKKVHLWYKILSLLLCNHQKLLNCQEVFSTWPEQEKISQTSCPVIWSSCFCGGSSGKTNLKQKRLERCWHLSHAFGFGDDLIFLFPLK